MNSMFSQLKKTRDNELHKMRNMIIVAMEKNTLAMSIREIEHETKLTYKDIGCVINSRKHNSLFEQLRHVKKGITYRLSAKGHRISYLMTAEPISILFNINKTMVQFYNMTKTRNKPWA